MAGITLAPDVPYDQGKIIRGRQLAPVTVSPTAQQYSDAGMTAPAPFNPSMHVVPSTGSPNLRAQLDTSSLPPDGMSGTLLQQATDQATRNGAATLAPNSPADAPAPPAVVWNGAPPTRPAPGPAALTNGVRRYNIGGDVGGANAAQVYTTMGKNGVPIFTDNANYAERNSNGRGLNKTIDAPGHAGGVSYGADGRASYTPGTPGYDPTANPTNLYANSMGPNANKEYMAPQLGLNGQQIAALNPNNYEVAGVGADGKPANRTVNDMQTAYSRAQQFAGADPRNKNGPTTDQGVSDDIALNQLRARMSGNGGSINGVGGAPGEGQEGGGAGMGMTPQTQIALYSAKQRAQLGQEKLTVAQAQLLNAQNATKTQAASAARQSAQDTFAQIQHLESDPQMYTQLGTYLAGKLQAGITKDPNYQDTDEGQQVANLYLTHYLQPGANTAMNGSTIGTNLNKARAIPALGYGNLNLNPDNSFDGMRRTGTQNADPEGADNAAYPASDTLGQRFLNGKWPLDDFANYAPSTHIIQPNVWKILRDHKPKGQ